ERVVGRSLRADMSGIRFREVRGNAGSPSDGLTVQALRNTRFFEAFAHAWKKIKSISPSIVGDLIRDRDISDLRAGSVFAISSDRNRHCEHGSWRNSD